VAHLAIIDAMGHGLPATLLSGLAVGSYRHSRRHGLDLVETYAAMDQAVAQQFGPERFVTAQLCRVERSTGRLRWVNAGHPAPLLVRGGRVVRVLTCAPSLPVGFGGAVTEIAEEALEPGDRLLFFTDGVVEARSPAGEFFGDQRLEELLTKAVAAGLPAPETVRRLTRELLAHQGGRLQDDATMLLLQWDGSDADPARAGGA
jgi:serine phosphatase RsbU (regulator of sigma subunit)